MAGLELFIRVEPVLSDFPSEVLGCIQSVFDERPEHMATRLVVRSLYLPPCFHTPLHREKASRRFVNPTAREWTVEILAVLGENNVAVAGETDR